MTQGEAIQGYQRDGQLAKAKRLGFNDLSYDGQWVIFNKARMFGWSGVQPSVLGTYAANKALDEVLD